MPIKTSVLTAYLLASLFWAVNAEAEGFSTGESVGQYAVVVVETHPEFQRLDCVGPEGTLRVEITFADSSEGPSTEHYRIQAAPGEGELPDDLVEALRTALLEMESRPSHAPFVARIPEVERSRGDPDADTRHRSEPTDESRDWVRALLAVMLFGLGVVLVMKRRAFAALLKRTEQGESTVGRRLLLVFFGLAICFLVAEGISRIYYEELFGASMGIQQAGLVAVDIPYVSFLYEPGEGGTNNMGLRVPYDTSPQKPEGTFRVLVIGDGVTFGESSQLEELFTYRLELLLEERVDRPVEVLNFSMPGLSLRQAVSLLEHRGLSWDPDLTVLAYCFNDPVETEILNWPNYSPGPSRFLTLLGVWLTGWEYPSESEWYDTVAPIYGQLEETFSRLGELADRYPIALIALPILVQPDEPQRHLPHVEKLTQRWSVPYFDIATPLVPQPLVSYRALDLDEFDYNASGHDAISVALAPLVVDWIDAQGADGQTPLPADTTDQSRPEHPNDHPGTD